MERSRLTVTENRHNPRSCVCEVGRQISANTHQGEGLAHETESTDLQLLRSVRRLSEATCNMALREAWRMWVGLTPTSSRDNSKEITWVTSVGGGALTGSNAGGMDNFKVAMIHLSTSSPSMLPVGTPLHVMWIRSRSRKWSINSCPAIKSHQNKLLDE